MRFWEMRYGDEPVSERLFLLLFLKKIYAVIISAVVGAVIVCGIHVAYRNSLEKKYMAETDIHLEYISDAALNLYIYYNEETWKQLSGDSGMIEAIISADPSLDEQIVRDSFLADLKADVKVLTLQVTTPDPALTDRIMQAAVQGLPSYIETFSEIEAVSVIGVSAETHLVPADVRPVRALILGAILGLFISCVTVSCRILGNDRIILPETIEKRYHIPAAGTLTSANIGEVLSDLAGDDGFVLTSALPETILSETVKSLKEAGAGVCDKVLTLDDTEEKGLSAKVTENDKPLVYVFSSKTDVKADERALSFLSKYDKEPMCAILIDSDDALIRNYYTGKRSRFAEDARNKK